MQILITGNMGYVGPGVVRHLRSTDPQAVLIGLDMGYFAHCLTNAAQLPESRLNLQHYCDVRHVPESLLAGVDAIVHLAAISNDPMGHAFEEVTLEINHRASIALAKKAMAAGVKRFVFASSCSVYGFAESGPRTEQSEVNPLTAYARSKVFTERDLAALAAPNFRVVCLRFPTACGMSDRLRLDLVLNDFVAGAVASRKITVLSDGSPWRPLINVRDMARAIDWALHFAGDGNANYLVVNAGSTAWNYQVKDLAEAVARVVPGVDVSINRNAQPDKRSYRVNFDLYERIAPQHQPRFDLTTTIQDLRDGLESMRFADPGFRNSQLMRLNVLTRFRELGQLNEQLVWSAASPNLVPA